MSNMSITERLAELRREMEEGATQVYNLQVPALLLLDDVCRALGLNDEERGQVLGRKAAQLLDQWAGASVMVAE